MKPRPVCQSLSTLTDGAFFSGGRRGFRAGRRILGNESAMMKKLLIFSPDALKYQCLNSDFL